MTTYRNLNSRPQPARGTPSPSRWRQRRPHPWGATCACTDHDHDAGTPDDARETFHDHEDEAPGEPVVTVASTAVVSDSAVTALKGLLREAGVASATITSGRRTPADQARIMYNNIIKYGVDYNYRLYGSYGDQVIAVFAAGAAARQSPDQIKQAMEAKINAIGPTKVSNHLSPNDVFDVAPSSIPDPMAFERVLVAAQQVGRVRKYFSPYTTPKDPAFHIEIARPATSAGELAEFLSEAPPLSAEAYSAEFAEAEAEAEAGGPSCGVARPGIAALGDLLRELDVAKAQTRRDSPQVVALRERIRDRVRAMIDDLPGFIERGCCAPHLAQLATEVDRLPWDSHPRVQEAGEALRRALERARERARTHGACRR